MTHTVTIREYKYGEFRGTEVREFKSLKALKEEMNGWKDQFNEDRHCYNKWFFEVIPSTGKAISGKLDL